MLSLKIMIDVLCAVGAYASVFMYRKSLRAQAGLVKGDSVVKRPAARLFFGIPNALFGILFYLALAIVIWFASAWWWVFIFAAVAAAALTSAYLAYRLLFVARATCPYCWTAHAVNWLLAVLTVILFRVAF